MKQSIPKIIHYCWFGGNPLSELAVKCINSWKKFLPDYEIVEWNEKNFIIDNVYAKEAFELGKWAFVSDYVRLKVIYEYGGIYLDTDVELIKSLEPLVKKGGFIGFEREDTVTTGLGLAAPKHSNTVLEMLREYDDMHFVKGNCIDNTPCPKRNTNALKRLGLLTNNKIQKIGDLTVYPKEYFCPLDYDSGSLIITDNTYSIHHYGYSWADANSIKLLEIKRRIFKIFPKFCAQAVFNLYNHIFLLFKRRK